MTYTKYIYLVLLLSCLRDCSCNNSDPCSNPSTQNAIVPFREVATTVSSLYVSFRQNILLYDSTNCYLFIGYIYSIDQREDS
jgi:hypothetical protein